jgi:Rrf2 family protein
MLSSRVRYALAALTVLARRPSQPRTAERLAAVTGAPLPTLFKVLQALARAGVIRTTRGPHGGVRLTEDSAAITVLDVVSAVDPTAHRRMLRSEALGPCLYRRLELLRQIAALVLGRTTVAELAGKAQPVAEGQPPSVEELLMRAIAKNGAASPALPRDEESEAETADRAPRRRGTGKAVSNCTRNQRGS